MIRHALPLRIDGGDAPADPSLAPEGVQQADRLASWWAPFGADAVYVSPMQRALETAAPLAAALELEAEVVPDLEEFDAHSKFYVPIEELRADEELWNKVVTEWLSPEAEQERQTFRTRVVAAIDAIVADHPGERVAIVCHGGVINAYMSSMLSMPGTMFFEPAYTSVNRALAGGTHKQLVSLNETPHLPTLVLPASGSL